MGRVSVLLFVGLEGRRDSSLSCSPTSRVPSSSGRLFPELPKAGPNSPCCTGLDHCPFGGGKVYGKVPFASRHWKGSTGKLGHRGGGIWDDQPGVHLEHARWASLPCPHKFLFQLTARLLWCLCSSSMS